MGKRRMPSRDAALVTLAFVGGATVAVQARVNGELGQRLHSAIDASVPNSLIGLAIGTAALATRGVDPVARLRSFRGPPWYLTGGLCGALFVYATVTTTPRLGVSLVSVAVAAGAASASLVGDALGLSIAGRHKPTVPRIAGASLAVLAVVVSANGASVSGRAGDFALATAGGFALGCQHPVNSRLGRAVGDPTIAVWTSFAVGSLATIAIASPTLLDAAWPRQPWLYAGGLIGALYVLLAIRVVERVGALRLSVATLGGQLVGAAFLDGVAPVNGRDLTAATIGGVVIALVAVAITGREKIFAGR
jgi:transporter family-2 protein